MTIFYTMVILRRGQTNRIPISSATATATGLAQVLIQSNETLYPQGFTFRKNDLWLANARFNQIDLFHDELVANASLPLSFELVAGSPNETVFAGPTDCEFGREPRDQKRGSMYVTTCGISGGKYTFGGSVWRLDVGHLKS